MERKGIWTEIREIHDVATLKAFVCRHVDLLKKIALPFVVIMSLLVFWVFGGDQQEIQVSASAEEAGAGIENVGENGGLTQDNNEVTNGGNSAGKSQSDGISTIYVDIGGQVNAPGVYEVSVGTRLFQLIEQAGGLKEDADVDSINQAEPVSDGQKIIIGSTDKNSPYYTGDGSAFQHNGQTKSDQAVTESENGVVVNINLADATQLQMISGIGPVTAEKIIAYREENGPFTKKEDIKNVSGIGDKTYESLKDFITV